MAIGMDVLIEIGEQPRPIPRHKADSGNFALLLGSTIVMSIVVVTVNRLVWRRLYRLAANRYTLEA